MIATGLTFLLGVFLTTLIMLLVGPLVWRKAQSLARRDYEATIPVSANEIRAEFDTVRAAAALTVRQHEILVAETREKTVRVQAQLGRSTVENVAILKRNRELLELAEDRAAEITQLTAAVARRDEENQALSKSLAATRREAELRGQELAALAQRFEDLGEIAEERKIQLVATEAKLDRLADAQRVAERFAREQQTTIERLRGEAAGLERTVAHDKTALAQLNERIAGLLTSLAERDTEIARLSPSWQAAAVLDPASPTLAAVPSPVTSVGEPEPSPAAELAAPKPAVAPAASAAPVAASIAPSAAEDEAGILSASKRLRAALARNAETAPAAETSRSEIRDRVSEIAARVIRMSTAAEGPQSAAINRALYAASDEGGTAAGPEDGKAPSLAERVRRMAMAEPNKSPGAQRPQSAGGRRE
ncbi:hypothetical protein [Aureimonas glaciei]|uniref:Uncharacterized protein n=1 Tax=Aureimonas glaciei TaxID=1776957 RepID=A0A916XU31_9HYPH|nr:hypothetical protein [Aureimonas glaciei]GGD09897.1 hypothetical protein GCM10011335_11010 [Aureimonas glaciei]